MYVCMHACMYVCNKWEYLPRTMTRMTMISCPSSFPPRLKPKHLPYITSICRIRIYIYTLIHIHTYIYIHIYTHIYIYIYISHTHIHIYTYTCLYYILVLHHPLNYSDHMWTRLPPSAPLKATRLHHVTPHIAVFVTGRARDIAVAPGSLDRHLPTDKPTCQKVCRTQIRQSPV